MRGTYNSSVTFTADLNCICPKWDSSLQIMGFTCKKYFLGKGEDHAKIARVYEYVIAWFAVVFGINSNAEIIVRGAAKYKLPHYEYFKIILHILYYSYTSSSIRNYIIHHYCMHISYPPCLCNHTQNDEPSTCMHSHTLPLLTLQLLLAHSHTHSFTHSHLHSPSSSSLLRARVSAISLTMGCSLASRTWRCS